MNPRFGNISCSQCGRDFGAGEHGYSHCSDHTGRQCAGCKWAQEKEDRYDQLRCCCNESPNAWSDVEATGSCERFQECDLAATPPKCEECDQPLNHERVRFFEDGACHVWSCGNEACIKWNLIKNTEADFLHNNLLTDP